MALAVDPVSSIENENSYGIYENAQYLLSMVYNAATYPLFAAYELACSYIYEDTDIQEVDKVDIHPPISFLPVLPPPEFTFGMDSLSKIEDQPSNSPKSIYGMINAHLKSHDHTYQNLTKVHEISLLDTKQRRHQAFLDYSESNKAILEKHALANSWRTLQMVSSVILTGVSTTVGLSLLTAASTPAVATGSLLALSGIASATALGLSYNDVYPQLAMGLTISSVALGLVSGAGYFAAAEALPTSANLATNILSILKGGSTIGRGLSEKQVEELDASLTIMDANNKNLERCEESTRESLKSCAQSYEVLSTGWKEIVHTLERVKELIANKR